MGCAILVLVFLGLEDVQSRGPAFRCLADISLSALSLSSPPEYQEWVSRTMSSNRACGSTIRRAELSLSTTTILAYCIQQKNVNRHSLGARVLSRPQLASVSQQLHALAITSAIVVLLVWSFTTFL